MRVPRSLTRCEGAAVPEFIVVAIGIMIPLAYLVVALADVLGAHAAAHHAVREAGRVFVRDVDVVAGQWRAEQAAAIAFADRGLVLPASTLTFACEPTCLQPGGTILVTIDWDMPLPWLPEPLSSIASVPIQASGEFIVDSFRPAGT